MNVHILNLAKYETPIVEEKQRNEWVTYGDDNSYYSFLIDRYKNSTTNNAIINNVARLVYGKGLSALDASRKPNEYAAFMAMFPKNDLRQLATDLKMLGQCAIQVHYSKDRSKVLKAHHIPVQLLAPEKCNKEGKIEAYYYSDNWSELRKFPAVRYDAFGFGKKDIEIYFIKPYAVGMKYFSYVDYQGALKYTLLEEEIADYLLNEVQQKFSGSTLVNFSNGIPSEEMQRIISNKVINKLTGTQGQRVIVAFNDNKETATTVEQLPLTDAPDLYTYLAQECLQKILIGHNVTSPLLFGIATTTGFSSNADELKNSSILFDNMVIKPLQMILIEAVKNILAINGIALNLYFKTLTPFNAENESTGNDQDSRVIDGINSLSPLVANKVLESMTANEIRALIGLKPETGGSDLAPELVSEFQLSKAKTVLEDIISRAELPSDEWVIVDEREVDLDSEDSLDLELETATNKIDNPTILSRLVNLVSGGNPKPTWKSTQDALIKGEKYFKVRYQYSGNPKPDREFCRLMMANSTRLFRREDIAEMSRMAVNPGFGEFGANTYDIFLASECLNLFKGGARCKHAWRRVTMMLDLNRTEAGFKQVGTRQAEIKGYKITNPYQVSIQPNNLPLKGFSPRNKNLPLDVQ